MHGHSNTLFYDFTYIISNLYYHISANNNKIYSRNVRQDIHPSIQGCKSNCANKE